MFGRKFVFRGPFMMEKNTSCYQQLDSKSKINLDLKCGFSIGYGIGRKYQPILVSVSVLNQNSGFGRTLAQLEISLVLNGPTAKNQQRCIEPRSMEV